MDSTEKQPRNGSQYILGYAMQAIVHILMTLLVAILLAWAVLPLHSLQALFQYSASVPDIRSMNVSQLAIQLGLAACIWAMCVILYKLVALHRAAPAKQRLRAARGTVLTEFLIILPVFLLLTFGMAQLSINNMAGMLANVAVYEAARAVWVWQPEVDSGRASANPADRARIAAAQVMTPIAPGSFTIIPTELSNEFKASRRALLTAQVPLGHMVPSDITDLAADLGSVNLKSTSEKNLTLADALDKSTFLLRSLTKYTHAYLATEITPITGAELGATLTYHHNQVMPLVGYVFGQHSGGILGLNTSSPGMRGGYYSTYKRTYTLKAQAWQPNTAMPNDDSFKEYDGSDKPGSPNVKGEIQGGAGGGW